MAGKNKGKLLKIGAQQETKKKNMLRLLKLEIITKITGSFLKKTLDSIGLLKVFKLFNQHCNFNL